MQRMHLHISKTVNQTGALRSAVSLRMDPNQQYASPWTQSSSSSQKAPWPLSLHDSASQVWSSTDDPWSRCSLDDQRIFRPETSSTLRQMPSSSLPRSSGRSGPFPSSPAYTETAVLETSWVLSRRLLPFPSQKAMFADAWRMCLSSRPCLTTTSLRSR